MGEGNNYDKVKGFPPLIGHQKVFAVIIPPSLS
jgi:hypothetical protein